MTTYKSLAKVKKNELIELYRQAIKTNSTLTRRAEIARGLGKQFGGDRDLYDAFGYTKSPDYTDYLNAYERDGIATRIVDAVAEETWRETPTLVEGENQKLDDMDNPGPLQKAFKALDDEFHVVASMTEADKLCGISRYSLIFLGLPGRPEDPAKGGKLMYVSVHDEGNSEVDEFSLVKDATDPRFGLPERYNIIVDDHTKTYIPVHHSRVIHIKEGTDKRRNRRIYGNPRLKQNLNRLWDLEKVIGGGSEAFWLLIRKGLALTAKEGVTLPKPGSEQYEELVDEIEEYEHGLSRIMKLIGFDVNDLGSEPATSRHQFDVIIEYLAGSSRIPQRILLGSERGNLASSQDEFNFDDFIRSRQTKFAEPYILRPLLKRFGELGILQLPEVYTILWKSLFQLTDMEKSTIATNTANALSTITGGAPETAMPVDVFTQRYLDYKPTKEEQRVMEKTKREADKANQKPPKFGFDQGQGFPFPSNGGKSKERERVKVQEVLHNLEKMYSPDGLTGLLVTQNSYHPFVMINEGGENSAMIAFRIPDELRRELKEKYPWMDDDLVNELHITLCYLGDARTLPLEKIEKAVQAFASGQKPLKIKMQGVGRFISESDTDPVIVTFDSIADELNNLRRILVECLEFEGIPYHREHGYIPHMTMAYIGRDDKMPVDTIDVMEMNFSSVYLVVGGEWKEYQFDMGVLQEERPIDPFPVSNKRAMIDHMVEVLAHGGRGSGNFGHAGRPGEVGGSAPKGTAEKKTLANVEEAIRDFPFEIAEVFAMDGKHVLSKIGTSSEVKFTLEEMATMGGTILTHNHPSGFPFSQDDLLFAENVQLYEIRVVTEEATYSIINPDWKNPRNVYRDYFELAIMNEAFASPWITDDLSPFGELVANELVLERYAKLAGLKYTKESHNA